MGGNGRAGPGFRVCDVEAGECASRWGGDGGRWVDRLLGQADRVAAGRLSYFDLVDCDLGSPIDWHRDHRAQVAAPRRYAPSIDYRDFGQTGDCKQVWEPNRHHQLVVLGRAYRATGERRYAQAAVEQLDHWIAENPYGIGMNWRSPLELGIRLINWVWTYDLIRQSGLAAGGFQERLMNSVYRHVWEVARKFSRASSANNHLIGEAAGVFIATSYWHGLRGAEKWRRRSREILLAEIQRQTHEDGGNKEQAIGYHLFVLQFFVLSGLVARWAGEDFPEPYWATVERMFEYVGAFAEGGENVPMFGDCDDGYVLDLGCDHHDFRAWLSAGAVLFKRPNLKAWARGYREPARWLLGGKSREAFEAIPEPDDDGRISSRSFPRTGYYLLQCGHRGSPDRISVLFDCGELGFGALAGHGHADALSVTLRAFGRDVLVDPGTYDYFSFPRWRDYFRSTRAHNTVGIDGRDQSEMLGLFLWGKRAHARCLEWSPGEQGGKVVGEHDGYRLLRDPVTHRRTVELGGDERTLVITDEILAAGRHEIEIRFHLAENCHIEEASGNVFVVDAGGGVVTMRLDTRLSVSTLCGSEEPIGGWVSRGYHRKVPSTTLAGRCVAEGSTSLTCEVEIGDPEAS